MSKRRGMSKKQANRIIEEELGKYREKKNT